MIRLSAMKKQMMILSTILSASVTALASSQEG